MAGELLQKLSVLTAEIEATAGTAETPAAADGAMNVSNKLMVDETEYVGLPSQGASLDQIRGSHGPRLGRVTFDVELIPGSGALPLWATALLPACGWVVSSVTYTATSQVPGSSVKTVTIGLYTNGIFERLHGAVGNAVFNFPAGRPASVSFSFMGIYTNPTDAAILAPNYPTDIQPLRTVSSSLVVGSFTPTTDQITFDMGNTIVPIPDVTTASGVAHCVITDRRPTISFGANTKLVASYDPWGDFINHTPRSISWSLASGGIGLTFTAPACEIIAPPAPGERGGLRVSNLVFGPTRNTDAGEDAMTIVFDHTV